MNRSPILVFFLIAIISGCSDEPPDPLRAYYDKYLNATAVSEADVAPIMKALSDGRARKSHFVRNIVFDTQYQAVDERHEKANSSRANDSYVRRLDGEDYVYIFHLSSLISNTAPNHQRVTDTFIDGTALYTFYWRPDPLTVPDFSDSTQAFWSSHEQAIKRHGGYDRLAAQLSAHVKEHGEQFGDELVYYLSRYVSADPEPTQVSSDEDDVSQHETLDRSRRQHRLGKLLMQSIVDLSPNVLRQSLYAEYVAGSKWSSVQANLLQLAKVHEDYFVGDVQSTLSTLIERINRDSTDVRDIRDPRILAAPNISTQTGQSNIYNNQKTKIEFREMLNLLFQLDRSTAERYACTPDLYGMDPQLTYLFVSRFHKRSPCLLKHLELAMAADRTRDSFTFANYANLAWMFQAYEATLEELNDWSLAQSNKGDYGELIRKFVGIETRKLGRDAYDFYRARLCDNKPSVDRLAHDRIYYDYTDDEYPDRTALLLQAFEQCGNMFRANRYLNYGGVLGKSAQDYARSHGYDIVPYDSPIYIPVD